MPDFKPIKAKEGSDPKLSSIIPVQLPNLQLEGCKRIFIELEFQPKEAQKYAKQYSDLVSSTVKLLREQGITPQTEEEFIAALWGLINSNMNMGIQKNQFLSNALKTNIWDCDVSAFLAFDVAKELGIDINMVVVPTHVFVATKNFFFETTSGSYHPIRMLREKYPTIFAETHDHSIISSISYTNRGLAFNDLGNYKQAIQDFTKAISLNPKDANIYNDRGASYANSGNHKQAIQDYTKAISLNPKAASAYYNRGHAYGKLGNHNQAILDFTKAIEIKPKDADAFRNRGIAYSKLGNYKQAIQDFTKSIELNPKHEYTYINRGISHGTIGNYKQAIQDLTKAIELNPKNPESYSNRGNANYSLGNYKQAIQDFTKTIELNPKSAYAYNIRAAAYKQLGEEQKAAADFKEYQRLLKK